VLKEILEMAKFNAEKEIKKMLATLTGKPESEIQNDHNLFTDVGIDSLKVIEIATYMEKKFKVTVPESVMPRIQTVKDAIEILDELVKNK
jgi:acyl carrier protein